MVIRVDNASACACINAGRALSKTMRRALNVITNIQEAHGCRVIAQHVRTEDNVVADLLSRGKYVQAEAQAVKMGPIKWGDEGGYMGEWERHLIRAQEDTTAKEGGRNFFT